MTFTNMAFHTALRIGWRGGSPNSGADIIAVHNQDLIHKPSEGRIQDILWPCYALLPSGRANRAELFLEPAKMEVDDVDVRDAPTHGQGHNQSSGQEAGGLSNRKA